MLQIKKDLALDNRKVIHKDGPQVRQTGRSIKNKVGCWIRYVINTTVTFSNFVEYKQGQ